MGSAIWRGDLLAMAAVRAVGMTHWIPARKPRKRAQLGLALTGEKPKPEAITDHAAERVVLRDVLELLNVHPRVAFAFRLNTASGFLVPARTWKAMLCGALAQATMARFIRFAFPGCSDILGMCKGGKFLAIECKASDGEPSDEQTAFLELVNRWGGMGILARSVSDVMDALPLEASAWR